MSDRLNILRNAYTKLDQLPLSFDLPSGDDITDIDLEKKVGGDLNDALREMKMQDTTSITPMSEDELYLENRVVYHMLRRFRNSASVNFKYSTGSDGKSVDKTQIPKILKTMIDEYDTEFKKWKRTSASGSIWNRPSTIALGMDSTAVMGGDSSAKY